MAGNKSLHTAKSAKNDEFYTQLSDIENELRHYTKHFKNKIVLCNCDDPYESNFFKYFALNFNKLGLKKLIATCYSGSPINGTEMTLDFGNSLTNPDNADVAKRKPYKAIISAVYDKNNDGGEDLSDIRELFKSGENELTELIGDGDFRSPECQDLLKEADIVVTNPPFSLFREFLANLIEFDKKFLLIGNVNAITYKEVFPLIAQNKLWLGHGFRAGNAYFKVQNGEGYAAGVYDPSSGLVKFRNTQWFTNLDHAKRHEQILLFKKYTASEYPKFDNYDAIEVGKVKDIPYDWEGLIGVPITFLEKYNPEQFEILGITKTWDDQSGLKTKQYPEQIQVSKSGTKRVTKLNDGPTLKLPTPPVGKTYYLVDDEIFVQQYVRILIRKCN